ncbi:hypothetical protein F2Q69_00028312 [Brassica cretica]|uniref:Uncharacterized protein n=1 Tax=Brassica cretica TaxID=69181 RepID=A0A8S9SB73_BRACR|nr:hypothetical protein F2Q69_00028312 [Brassica cretica]
MAKKRNSHGKEISDEVVEVEDVKAALSEKLFATDRCPCERVHMYSTIGNLLWVRNKLDGTPEMKLMGSWFGSLFKISVRRLLMGKVVYMYMCTYCMCTCDIA